MAPVKDKDKDETSLIQSELLVNPRPSVLKTIASYIIVTEFCERLAYYGFAGSLVLFFETKLNLSNEDAINQFYLWNGFVYVTPLIGGYVADTCLGRYKTILLFSVFYLVGLCLFVFGTIPGAINMAVIFTAMYLIAFAAGGIKPNVSTMGADQFDNKYAQDKKEAGQFFSYFYWSINLGALCAYTLIAYICQYGLPFAGGESWGFFIGYSIPTVMMTVGIVIFVSGSARYKKQPPHGSMISIACGIFYEGVTLPKLSGQSHWLDKASKEHGGSYESCDVEGMKYIWKIVPYLLVMIPFWGIYGQTKTAFQIQGCQMNLDLNGFQLPVSAMNIFNNIAILSLVPFLDQVIYPYLKDRGYVPGMLPKIGFGFILAMCAMLLAALIEVYRLKEAPEAGDYYSESARDNISPCRDIDNFDPYKYQSWLAGDEDDEPSNCYLICDDVDENNIVPLSCISCDDIPQMSNISIFWQIPQFVFIGVSEIFASITSLEFFYSQAPSQMRSVSQAANLFTNAVGSWLTIPLTILVNINSNDEWVASNVDEGHLDYYFYLLAGLMLIAECCFAYMSHGYEYADPDVLDELSAASLAKEEAHTRVESIDDILATKPLLSPESQIDDTEIDDE